MKIEQRREKYEARVKVREDFEATCERYRSRNSEREYYSNKSKQRAKDKLGKIETFRHMMLGRINTTLSRV